MKIPVAEKESLFIGNKDKALMESFFTNNYEEWKDFFETIKKPGANKHIRWFVFFNAWTQYLEKCGEIIPGQSANMLLIEAVPYFLLYCGIDFRDDCDISKIPYYENLEIKIKDYDIERFGR